MPRQYPPLSLQIPRFSSLRCSRRSTWLPITARSCLSTPMISRQKVAVGEGIHIAGGTWVGGETPYQCNKKTKKKKFQPNNLISVCFFHSCLYSTNGHGAIKDCMIPLYFPLLARNRKSHCIDDGDVAGGGSLGSCLHPHPLPHEPLPV